MTHKLLNFAPFDSQMTHFDSQMTHKFICENCNKSFSRKNNMNRHMKNYCKAKNQMTTTIINNILWTTKEFK